MNNRKKIEEFLDKALQKRAEEGRLRKLQNVNGLVDFCSNDYLGFSNSIEFQQFSDFQTTGHQGSTGSRLLTGNSLFAEELEEFIANFHNASSGLIFNSGYDANIGLFSSVPQKNDIVIYDELIHASIRDGIRLGMSSGYSFRHNDLRALEDKLIKAGKAGGHIFVAVESVYSMDGDLSPLQEISDLCKQYHANLIVDEAHATGLFGKKGEGRVCELNLENKVFARVHTFGKALGGHGAVVLGPVILKQYLINFARSFIYTTALPAYSLKVIKNAYDILSNNDFNSFKMKSLILLFKAKVEGLKKVKIIESQSPIQSIIIPGNDRVKALAAVIQKAGFDVRPILSPTVKKGEERLRICLHSFNSEKEITGLFSVLKENL